MFVDSGRTDHKKTWDVVVRGDFSVKVIVCDLAWNKEGRTRLTYATVENINMFFYNVYDIQFTLLLTDFTVKG